MRASPALLYYLKQREQFRGLPYLDQAGKLTIGYGHLIRPNEHKSLTHVSRAQADALLQADVETFAVYLDGVSRNFKAPLSQTQFDGVLSFVFNVGMRAFEESDLLVLLRAGDFAAAEAQFARWVYITATDEQGQRYKQISSGLKNRRRMDWAIFSSGVYAA